MTSSFSFGTTTYSSDDLAVLDIRHQLGDKVPKDLMRLGGSIHNFVEDLPTGAVPTALYQSLFTLVATEALIESGRAVRVNRVQVSPIGPREGKCVSLGWVTPIEAGTQRGSASKG